MAIILSDPLWVIVSNVGQGLVPVDDFHAVKALPAILMTYKRSAATVRLRTYRRWFGIKSPLRYFYSPHLSP
jgi:hypothetical protein